MTYPRRKGDRGPFTSDQLRCGDPYELSDGHAIRVAPTGSRGSSSVADGALVLKTDPDVDEAGIDTGYSPEPGMLRAPDIAVGHVPNAPGWVKGVPPLAVEYADVGQDEDALAQKITDLLNAGTRAVWVVRLSGARRVEVHEPNKPMHMVLPGEELHAAGVLRNPVPVNALFDPQDSMEAALRNLLQRKGYESVEQIRQEGAAQGKAEGKAEGLRQSILALLEARGMEVTAPLREAIEGCSDASILETWLRRAVTAESADEVIEVGSR